MGRLWNSTDFYGDFVLSNIIDFMIWKVWKCFHCRDRSLNKWLELISTCPIVDTMYERDSFMRDPNLFRFLTAIIGSLDEYQFTLDPSLTKGVEIWSALSGMLSGCFVCANEYSWQFCHVIPKIFNSILWFYLLLKCIHGTSLCNTTGQIDERRTQTVIFVRFWSPCTYYHRNRIKLCRPYCATILN